MKITESQKIKFSNFLQIDPSIGTNERFKSWTYFFQND